MRSLTCVALAVFCATAARAAEVRVGLYPIALPAGQASFQRTLAARIEDGAKGLPGVASFELLPTGYCLSDEAECLRGAAKRARVERLVSIEVQATAGGYRTRLMTFSAGGTRMAELAEELRGGPLDLAGAIEHGVCRVLGTPRCAGELRILARLESAGSARLFVDGQDLGLVRDARPLALPVGRHSVRVGSEERRVRIAYGRATEVVFSLERGAPTLSEGQVRPASGGAAPERALAQRQNPTTSPNPITTPNPTATTTSNPTATTTSNPTATPTTNVNATPTPPPLQIVRGEPTSRRAATGRLLVAGGAGLLAVSVGLGLYSRVESHRLDGSGARIPGIAAALLAATGAGAVAAGGFVLLLAPSGVAVQGRF